jgi:hypothetical protein
MSRTLAGPGCAGQEPRLRSRGASCGFRRRRTLIPEGTRTAFRAEGEQCSERGDPGNSIVQEALGFIKQNHPERSVVSGHGAGRGVGSPMPRSAHPDPGGVTSMAGRRASCAYNLHASPPDAHCEPAGRECRRQRWVILRSGGRKGFPYIVERPDGPLGNKGAKSNQRGHREASGHEIEREPAIGTFPVCLDGGRFG